MIGNRKGTHAHVTERFTRVMVLPHSQADSLLRGISAVNRMWRWCVFVPWCAPLVTDERTASLEITWVWASFRCTIQPLIEFWMWSNDMIKIHQFLSNEESALQFQQSFVQQLSNTIFCCCRFLVPVDSCCYGALYSSCIQPRWLSSHSPSPITSCSQLFRTACLHTLPPDSSPPYVSVSSNKKKKKNPFLLARIDKFSICLLCMCCFFLLQRYLISLKGHGWISSSSGF